MISYAMCRILGCTLDYLGGILSKKISNDLSINLKRTFFKHYYEISPDLIYFEKFEKMYAIYVNDISTVASGFCGPVLWFLSSMSLFLWSSVTLISIRWELASIYIAAALMIVYTTVRTGKLIRTIQGDIRKADEDRIFLSKSAIEQYMKLLIMKCDEEIISKNVDAEEIYNNLSLRESKLSYGKTLVNDIVYYLAGAFVWLFGSFFILKNDMTAGELVAFISFSGMIISPIVRFSSQWIAIQKIRVSQKRIVDFLHYPAASWGDEVINKNTKHSLVLDNVSFGYSKDSSIIKNLTYQFEAGNIYCITGENGSGKSTLFKLICRVLNTYKGVIRFDGEDIRNFEKDAMYNIFAYEDEHPIIVYGTLFDNLTFGIKEPKMEEVQYLYEKIGLASSLGDKYTLNTILEKGDKQLSHGQKQLIGIVRNLLSHKEVMILDESFSGIADSLVAVIMDTYKEYCRENLSMMLYVSHNKEHQKLTNNHLCISDGDTVG